MSGAKTEEPTPRRLRQAREEGDSGASVFASQAIALVAAIALLPATAAAVVLRVEERLREAIDRAAAPSVTASFDMARTAADVVFLCLPIVAAVAIASAASSLAQTGGLVGGRRLAPKLGRLDPVAGLGRLVSRAQLFAVGRALAGGGFIAWVLAHQLRGRAVDIVRTSGRLAFAGPAAMAIAKTIAWEAALLGLAIAAIDVVVMRLDWRRRLRMSRDEVQRELKETGGDPIANEARKRARAELAARGTIADVRLAKVVIRDESRAVYALRYEGGDRAPSVLASGEGPMAEGMLREARRFGLAVVHDAELARALAQVAAGETIPETLYDRVAEILRDEAE